MQCNPEAACGRWLAVLLGVQSTAAPSSPPPPRKLIKLFQHKFQVHTGPHVCNVSQATANKNKNV